MPIDPTRLASAIPRLEREHNIWIATSRPDGRPHLVPIWFVWHDEKVWICTPRESQKIRNLQKNAAISLSLEDGTNPLVIEGNAELHFDPPWPDVIVGLFAKKYDWDIRSEDSREHMLVEITPERLLFQ